MKNSDTDYQSGLGKILNLYIKRCTEEQEPGSLINTKVVMKSFDEYLTHIDYNGSKITLEMIEGWVTTLESRLSDARIAIYEYILGKMLRFASAFGIESQPPEIMKVADYYQPYIYSEKELEKICEVADNLPVTKRCQNPWIQAEIPMLIRILASCGTRVTELLCLKMQDVDLENGILYFKKSKENVERMVPMTPELTSLLSSYAHMMGLVGKSDAYLFPGNTRDEYLTRQTFKGVFIKILRLAGITVARDHKGAHSASLCSFRHTFACNSLKSLKKQGVDVDNLCPYLSTYMGHKDLSGTEKYLKFPASMVEEELEDFNLATKPILKCRVFNDASEWI